MNEIDKMLETAIEIEGLIRIIRDGDPTEETYELLRRKIGELKNRREEIPERAVEMEKEADVKMEEAEEVEMEAAKEEVSEDDDILLSFDDENESATADLEKGIKPSSRNLKARFSLNDRFLYARELFDNNMKTFDSTLKSLEGVKDFGVIEDYFYNELDWDPQNPIVKEFMEKLNW